MAEWQVLWGSSSVVFIIQNRSKAPPLSALAFACLLFQIKISVEDHRGRRLARLIRGERGGAALVDAGHSGPRAGHAALRRLVDGGEPVRVEVPVFLHVLVLCAYACVIADALVLCKCGGIHQIRWG